MARDTLKGLVAGLRKAKQGPPLEPPEGGEQLDLFAFRPKAPAPEAKLGPMERQRLNNALAKAKLGKKLTHAEKHLLGKHNLRAIVARLPKGD